MNGIHSNRKLFIKGVLLFITILLLSPASVFGETITLPSEPSFQTFTLEDFGFTGDETFQGVLVSRDYGINLPAYWRYSSAAVVNLQFSHSPALSEKSTLSVDWNGVRIGSQALTAENIDGGSLVFEIPAKDLAQGYNTLRVEFYMGISEDFCNDVDNPAVWAVVHQATTLKLNFQAMTPRLELSAFPLPFVDSSPVARNDITIVVPSQPGSGELNALAAVSAKLGEFAGGWQPLNVRTVTMDEALKNTPKGNLIVLSTFEGLRKFFPGVALERGQAGSGILYEQVSPFDGTALMLIVSGETQAEVEKAGRALTNESLYPRLSGASAHILEVPETASGQGADDITYTLKQLGYQDQAVYSSRGQQASFTIPLKALWQNNSSAMLDLHFVHSLEKGSRITLTATVNGLPVGEAVVNGGEPGDKHETFQLPLNFFKTGVNYLTIQPSVQHSSDFRYCMEEYYSQAWLTIANDSRITFPSPPDKVTASIANFPYAFIGSNDLSQLAFVLPDKPDLVDMQALTALAVRIGQIANGSLLRPSVLNAAEAKQAEANYPYQILVGLPLKNNAILDAGESLPQAFDPESGQALPVAGLSTIDTSKIDTGYIQTFVTEFGVPRLVVSGNSNAGLLTAIAHLSDADKSILLEGDLAVTTSNTQAASQWLINEADQLITLPLARQGQQSWVIWFQPNGVLYSSLAILLMTLLVLILHTVVTFSNKKSSDK